MEHELLRYINNLQTHPALLLVVLGVVSFVWADFAVICGAVFVSQNILTAPLFALLLFVMIFSGDAILYGLGKYAGRLPFVASRTHGNKAQKISELLHRNFFEAVFFSRFVPALRVPTYMLIGGLSVPFTKFAKYVAAIILLWNGGLFTIGLVLGNYAFDFINEYKFTALILIAGIIWLIPRGMTTLLKSRNRL